jgi:hypothetical protein
MEFDAFRFAKGAYTLNSKPTIDCSKTNMCLYNIFDLFMENPRPQYIHPTTPSTIPSVQTNMFSNQNNVIILLLVLLIFSFLGINLLVVSGNAFKTLADMFGPVLLKVASMLGYSTGQLVNTTADVTADTAKLGVDIAEGTAQSIGNLLKDASKGGMSETDKQNLERALTPSNCPKSTPSPEPDKATNVIQNPITAKKTGWCLVGEDNGTRGCVLVDEHDKCMSGQIFPSKMSCLQPTKQ